MKLHFRTIGEGKPLIILHGLFGSSDNWQTIGKVFAERFKVYMVDLRNHGNSPHSDEFTYDLIDEDLIGLLDDEGLEKAHVLGHSLGGKVGMHLSTRFQDRVDKLVVIDIAPRYYPPHHQDVFRAFRSVDLKAIKSRKEASDQMSTIDLPFGVRQFILKNLTRNADEQFIWKVNLDVLERANDKIGGGFGKNGVFTNPTLFIAGENSDYILPEDHEKIGRLFPSSKVETIADAGHWVHADKPEELREMVLDFLE
ncbi:MAG: alpha/beta fold hydrolase [Cyclobacteriaceae bacterium]